MQIRDKLKRQAANLALSLLIPFLIRKGSNTDRLPCWNRLNRLVDVLTVVSEGSCIDE